MPFRPGDIYWAEPSQTIGHEQRGMRPYIVMSRASANQHSVTAVPFTSDKDPTRPWPAFCIRLPALQVNKEPASTYHVVDSVALCHQVRVLDPSCLREKIGRLNQTAIVAIQLGLAHLFDIR